MSGKFPYFPQSAGYANHIHIGIKIGKYLEKILPKCTPYLFCGGVRSAKKHLSMAWQRLLFVMHIKGKDCGKDVIYNKMGRTKNKC